MPDRERRVREGQQVHEGQELAQLDPTVGSEIQKTRPCVVVSPEEMNNHLRTVIVAPATPVSPLSWMPLRLASDPKNA